MTYIPMNWVDEIPNETPVKYVITGSNSDCTIALKTAPTAGTPLNATNLNHIEQGIVDTLVKANAPVSHRQGDANNWGGNYGTTNYDVSTNQQLIQVGCSHVLATGDLVITFPVPFAYTPVVVATNGETPTTGKFIVANYVTATGFHLSAWSSATARTSCYYAHWIAIGPAIGID